MADEIRNIFDFQPHLLENDILDIFSFAEASEAFYPSAPDPALWLDQFISPGSLLDISLDLSAAQELNKIEMNPSIHSNNSTSQASHLNVSLQNSDESAPREPATTPAPMANFLYEFEAGPCSGTPRRKRGRFSPKRGKEVGQLRKVGACARCRLTKSSVSGHRLQGGRCSRKYSARWINHVQLASREHRGTFMLGKPSVYDRVYLMSVSI